MEDKVANSIALHQTTINELQEIKKQVEENIDDIVQFDIRTRCIFRTWEPYINRIKTKMDISPRTMNLILDEAIAKERERINKLIDMEIEKKFKK